MDIVNGWRKGRNNETLKGDRRKQAEHYEGK
jgi:hypothetical protein